MPANKARLNSNQPQVGKILCIPIGIAGHKLVCLQQGMRRDHEICQQALWRTSAGTATANGIRREARCRQAPDILPKIEVNGYVHLPEYFLNALQIERGHGRKFDEDGRAYD